MTDRKQTRRGFLRALLGEREPERPASGGQHVAAAAAGNPPRADGGFSLSAFYGARRAARETTGETIVEFDVEMIGDLGTTTVGSPDHAPVDAGPAPARSGEGWTGSVRSLTRRRTT